MARNYESALSQPSPAVEFYFCSASAPTNYCLCSNLEHIPSKAPTPIDHFRMNSTPCA